MVAPSGRDDSAYIQVERIGICGGIPGNPAAYASPVATRPIDGGSPTPLIGVVVRVTTYDSLRRTGVFAQQTEGGKNGKSKRPIK
jgi:hypothetical protein